MLKTRIFVLAALSLISSPARAAAPPSDWLKIDGKGAEWTRQTAKCRELLAKLKRDDPNVKRYLPKIMSDCAMLAKHKGGFNWRTVTGVEFLENILYHPVLSVQPAASVVVSDPLELRISI